MKFLKKMLQLNVFFKSKNELSVIMNSDWIARLFFYLFFKFQFPTKFVVFLQFPLQVSLRKT